MEVSFVNAGILTLERSVGLTFGATIGTYITFISIIKFYFTFGIKTFKFLQLLFLINTKVTITLEQ